MCTSIYDNFLKVDKQIYGKQYKAKDLMLEFPVPLNVLIK